eukprot:TRINITY_DN877_c0_g2_i8.p1 TRINITY_DN877_c0_g2~~TRINITY_DN877_c0_g2_i8.p1  ORF type:complete len:2300 (+),score=608.25 TRINITY_DN877_c0_g2_i8:478-7377(+)
MDYEDIIGSNSDLVDNGRDHSDAEEHQGLLARFLLAEDLGVQLGFEEGWDSHFSREESSVLGLDGSSQNTDFTSSNAKCIVNVWSEVTSTESVQMLSNSVACDTETHNNDDPERAELGQTNNGEFNASKFESLLNCSDPIPSFEHRASLGAHDCVHFTMDVKEEEHMDFKEEHVFTVMKSSLNNEDQHKSLAEDGSIGASCNNVNVKVDNFDKGVIDTDISSQVVDSLNSSDARTCDPNDVTGEQKTRVTADDVHTVEGGIQDTDKPSVATAMEVGTSLQVNSSDSIDTESCKTETIPLQNELNVQLPVPREAGKEHEKTSSQAHVSSEIDAETSLQLESNTGTNLSYPSPSHLPVTASQAEDNTAGADVAKDYVTDNVVQKYEIEKEPFQETADGSIVETGSEKHTESANEAKREICGTTISKQSPFLDQKHVIAQGANQITEESCTGMTFANVKLPNEEEPSKSEAGEKKTEIAMQGSENEGSLNMAETKIPDDFTKNDMDDHGSCESTVVEVGGAMESAIEQHDSCPKVGENKIGDVPAVRYCLDVIPKAGNGDGLERKNIAQISHYSVSQVRSGPLKEECERNATVTDECHGTPEISTAEAEHTLVTKIEDDAEKVGRSDTNNQCHSLDGKGIKVQNTSFEVDATPVEVLEVGLKRDKVGHNLTEQDKSNDPKSGPIKSSEIASKTASVTVSTTAECSRDFTLETGNPIATEEDYCSHVLNQKVDDGSEVFCERVSKPYGQGDIDMGQSKVSDKQGNIYEEQQMDDHTSKQELGKNNFEKDQDPSKSNEINTISQREEPSEEYDKKQIEGSTSQRHNIDTEMVIEEGNQGCDDVSDSKQRQVESESKQKTTMESQKDEATIENINIQETLTANLSAAKHESRAGSLDDDVPKHKNETFTFDTLPNKDVSFGEETDGSSKSATAVQQDHVGCSKPFETATYKEKDKDVTLMKSGEVEVEESLRQSEQCPRDNTAMDDKVMRLERASSGARANESPAFSVAENINCVDDKEFENPPVTPDTKSKAQSAKLDSSTKHSSVHGIQQNQANENVTRKDNKALIDSSPIRQGDDSSTVSPSSLPDLNATSKSTSVPFLQPFTDAQQVQLRAQILVYGSLIQGSLPDEDLMLTAFADIRGSQSCASAGDGSRGLWENIWRLAADRLQHKMFSTESNAPQPTCASTSTTVPTNAFEPGKNPTLLSAATLGDGRTTVSGLGPADMTVSGASSLPMRISGALSTGRLGNKNSLPSIMTPPHNLAISSPIWNISSAVSDGGSQGSSMSNNANLEPHHIAAARHSYQSPQIGHIVTGASSTRMSPFPLPGPWITAQGALADSSIQLSNFSITAITPEVINNRRTSSSAPCTSRMPSASHPGSTDISKAPLPVPGHPSSDKKSGKRRKKGTHGDRGTVGAMTPSSRLPPNLDAFSKHPPDSLIATSVGASLFPTSNPTSFSSSIIGSTTLPTMSHYQVISKGERGQKAIFSEETATRIEQARLNAEDAAACATSAVRHSQEIWSQLAAHKESTLVYDCESKLASAAVTAAAAASIAKAAAAAARLASDAALQAKLIASDALSTDGKRSTINSTEMGRHEAARDQSQSIIATARESSKKRIESVAAAAKRAENLDAIVSAAELAAHAVSQAGVIASMGDPIPLSLNMLLEAGPEGYWKLVNQDTVITRKLGTNNGISGGTVNETVPEEINKYDENNLKSSKDKTDGLKKDSTGKNAVGETLKQAKDTGGGTVKLVKEVQTSGVSSPLFAGNRDAESQMENQVPHKRIQSSSVPSEMQPRSREELMASNGKRHKESVPLKSNEIKEGSLVEVVSDEEGLRGVWFAAKVLHLKDGRAYVRYDELLADDGVNQLEEWIPLEGENGNAPRIRMAHPMTVMKFEGTRKRRREAMGNHTWTVGDRVDAWMRDGWWEGVITSKNDNDESKFTIYFPGEGDTSVIKAWNLRPSLIWKDDQWIEWTYLKGQGKGHHEGGLPTEKRRKVDSLETIAATGRGRPQRIPNVEEAKKMQELNSVMTSCNDRNLMSSKSSAHDHVAGSVKVSNIGLLKEGSKVVFGVPKPTKKRKFMDVSKHYVVDPLGKNTTDGKHATRTDKHKTSVVLNSNNGLKSVGKAEDKRGKKPLIPKHKSLKTDKTCESQLKTVPAKDQPIMPTITSPTTDGARTSQTGDLEASLTNNQKAEATHLSHAKENLSPRAPHSIPGKSLTAELEQQTKGKLSTTFESSAQFRAKNFSPSDLKENQTGERSSVDKVEPRRSSRRIQPTSRLLESLQTSPSMLKSSAYFAHERGGKGHSKT